MDQGSKDLCPYDSDMKDDVFKKKIFFQKQERKIVLAISYKTHCKWVQTWASIQHKDQRRPNKTQVNSVSLSSANTGEIRPVESRSAPGIKDFFKSPQLDLLGAVRGKKQTAEVFPKAPGLELPWPLSQVWSNEKANQRNKWHFLSSQGTSIPALKDQNKQTPPIL